ncbi:MAG: hypothetical protein IT458_18730 [Planctomycetes bacterium]|nr:hypothetical protein [Planctomycetota bacterium]
MYADNAAPDVYAGLRIHDRGRDVEDSVLRGSVVLVRDPEDLEKRGWKEYVLQCCDDARRGVEADHVLLAFAAGVTPGNIMESLMFTSYDDRHEATLVGVHIFVRR